MALSSELHDPLQHQQILLTKGVGERCGRCFGAIEVAAGDDPLARAKAAEAG